MYKKLLVSVFLCFFVFSLGMIAIEKEEEKAKTIEFLLCEGVQAHLLYSYIPNNHTQLEGFKSPLLKRVHVPASPKSDALFFEISGMYIYAWSGYQEREARCSIYCDVVSDFIPEDIFTRKLDIRVLWVSETNFAYNLTPPSSWLSTGGKYEKSMMKRDSHWYENGVVFYYRGTLEPVPDDVAIPIINNLIDNGFDIEIYAGGGIKGVREIKPALISIEVTRLSKD